MYDRIKQIVSKEKDSPNQKIIVPKMTLTVEQMADELNISKPTAYNLVKTAGFPALSIGHRVLINRAGLQRWLDEKCSSHSSN